MPRNPDHKVGQTISYGNVLWALALSGYGAFRLLLPYHGQHLLLTTIWCWFLIAAGVILALVALLAGTVRHHHHPAGGPAAPTKFDDAHPGA